MGPTFVTVYAKTTGAKQRIPAHWLNIPKIARQFNKTPRQRRADERSQTPAADPVAPTDAPDTTAGDDTETPAAGDQKE